MALANITNNILTDSGILVTNLTPTSRTITINGVTYDLSADRSWTIATGVGGSGTTNYLPKFTGTSTIGNSSVQDNGTLVTITSNTAGNSTLNLISSNSVNSGKIQFGGATFGATIEKNSLGADSGLIFNSYHGGAEGYTFQSNGTNVMKLSASGNLGLGVTPSAWMSGSTGLQVLRGGLWHDGSGYISMFNNAYYDGSNWRYIASTTASNYAQVNGNHQWFQAPSGTAGNVISFTQAMTLDASGNLSLGATSNYGSGARLTIQSGPIIAASSTWNNTTTGGAISMFSDNANYGSIWALKDGNQAWGNIAIARLGGNVGIGNDASGGYKLDVSGTGRFRVATNQNVRISSETNTSIQAVNDAANAYVALKVDGSSLLLNSQSGGNVGIGTTSPATALHVYNASQGVARFESTQGEVNIALNNSSASGNLIGTVGAAFYFYSGGSERMRLNASGNLSIGNTNDTYKLDVSGTGRFSSSLTARTSVTGSGTNASPFYDDAINLGPTTNQSKIQFGNSFSSSDGTWLKFIVNSNAGANSPLDVLTLSYTGAATFSSSVTASYYDGAVFRVFTSSTFRGGVGTGSWAFGDSSNDMALYSEAAIKLGAGGSQKMIITSGGEVGIGTTTMSSGIPLSISAGVGLNTNIAFQQNAVNKWFIRNLDSTDDFSFYYAPSSAERMRITSGGNVEINTGSIKTGAPTNGTAQPWKLGTVYTGTCVPNSFGDFTSWFQGTVIEIEVNGTTYKIPAIIDNYC